MKKKFFAAQTPKKGIKEINYMEKSVL